MLTRAASEEVKQAENKPDDVHSSRTAHRMDRHGTLAYGHVGTRGAKGGEGDGKAEGQRYVSNNRWKARGVINRMIHTLRSERIKLVVFDTKIC